MKRLRKIILNPFGVVLTSVHWLLLVYGLLSKDNGQSDSYLIPDQLWLKILVFADFPIFLVSKGLFDIITNTLNRSAVALIIFVVQTFLFITFQWLFIGYVISRLIEKIKSKNIVFSLK